MRHKTVYIQRLQQIILFAAAAVLLIGFSGGISCMAAEEPVGESTEVKAAPTFDETVKAMKRATDFMMNKVSYRKSGAFVWNYLPDMSRMWGEMEAYHSMAWMQSPGGTSKVGHMLLDAYHATGDEYFFKKATTVALTVAAAQKKTGGWHYFHNFAGERSTQKWYDTIGKNGWRLEEFLYNWGNATFDDAVTTDAASLLLRMYLEKHQKRFLIPLKKTIKFVLEAQYDNGGWPQRYPFVKEFSHKGKPDYSRYITLNDNVAQENIQFLTSCYQTLTDEDIEAELREEMQDSIFKAMDIFPKLQGPPSQPGFSLQYTTDLQPIGARTYEPDGYTTHTTQSAVTNLLIFYQITADEKYLAPIDAALDWLDSVALPTDYPNKPANRSHATFMEFGTDTPIFVHRRGSNIVSGEYFSDYDSTKVITHYGIWRSINTAKLRKSKEELMAKSKEELLAASPLYAEGLSLPMFYSFRDVDLLDLKAGDGRPANPSTAETTAEMIAGLNKKGYWPTVLDETSNPYIGDGPAQPSEGDYSETKVGDKWDTSPYNQTEIVGISTKSYVSNMGVLIDWAYQLKQTRK